MSARGLIDTGAILALLDKSDRWHDRCVRAFKNLPLPLGTSAAVLAELFHLLDSRTSELNVAWRFLNSGAVTVLGIDDSDLPALEELMKKYHDRPMDFADATLVHLARRESLVTVFTIDHADFETYRISGKRRFRIVPEQ
jgi:predicted nucleic acid-binding protein